MDKLGTGNPGEFAHGVNPEYPSLSGTGKSSVRQSGKLGNEGTLLGVDQAALNRQSVREGQKAAFAESTVPREKNPKPNTCPKCGGQFNIVHECTDGHYYVS